MRNRGLLLPVLLCVGVLSCTATRTREFTREAYEPAPDPAASSRVFEGPPDSVRAALREVLAGRGATLEEDDRPGELLAAVPWADAGEAAASVDLGRVRRVITRTERAYRSWSPLDFRCDACIVRKGGLVSQKTELVEDETVVLDASDYRIEATVRARLEALGDGTRVVLGLEPAVHPPEPAGVRAHSTGRLEAQLLEALESALLR